jgi:ATP-dependent Clp protease, protease subunit
MTTKLLQLLSDNKARAFSNQLKNNIVNSNDGSVTRLYLYDPIVSDQFTAEYFGGISAQELVPQIAQIKSSTIHVHINSPGGDVFAAQAISAALEAHPANVIAYVDGVAASAATRIACACNDVVMAKGSMYMIHNAWTFTMGNKEDLQKTVDLMQKIDANLVSSYAEKTGKDEKTIQNWMMAETWFTAQEAVDNGFANMVFESKDATAKPVNARAWNLSAYANTPKCFSEILENSPQALEPVDKTIYASEDHRARQAQRLQIMQRTQSV